MKFEEVLPALKEGKKIRRRAWLGVDYIYVRDGSIVDNNGDFFEIDFSITLYDDWKIRNAIVNEDVEIAFYKDGTVECEAYNDGCCGRPFTRCRTPEQMLAIMEALR